MSDPIVIWGSGAIGGTIGAHLRRAGRDVLFVDQVQDHVDEIAAGRFEIVGPIHQFTVGAPAMTPDRMSGSHKIIILAVKSQHTAAATQALAPFLAADGVVVSCQNGLNELTIAEIVGRQRTIGSFVNFGADYEGPGRITYGLRGAVVVGELDGTITKRVRAIHELLQLFEPDAALSDNIFGYLWGKSAYGAILTYTALTNETIADFLADRRRRPVIISLAQEILGIAAAEGVTPLGFDGFDPMAFHAKNHAAIEASLAKLIDYNRGSGKPHTGIWRDLVVRRRPTEVPAQWLAIKSAAQRHGLAAPLYGTLVSLISAVERGEREVGDELADELS